MRNLVRAVAAVLFLALTVGSAAEARARSGYESIGEIRENTPERWTQTYETKWRTVEIDVPVEVPDVDRFPVIRITARDPVDEPLTTGYQKVTENNPGNFYAYMGEASFPLTGNEWIRYAPAFENGEIPDEQPENNPMTYQEALDTIYGECARLFCDVELSVIQTVLQGRVYHYRTVNHERVWLDPVTEKGNYCIQLSQRFRGIDYQPAVECYGRLNMTNEAAMCPRYVYCNVYSTQDYLLAAFLDREVDMIYDDVPILPFGDAKAAVETEIQAGHLRGIDTMELCYAPYYDPDDVNTLWLLPVWYAEGPYTRDVKREFTPWKDDTGHVVDNGVEYGEVVYQAQLGALMNYDDTRGSRRKLPTVLTWDDVQ